MKDLIEALQIFLKYVEDKNDLSPTHCEHDVLSVVGIPKDKVSKEDTKRLKKLGFLWSKEDECWISFRFGSA